MTQEQKAKRYDEAIEIARKIENGELINVPDGTHILVAIFPELKELNDERIRKELLEHCKNQAEPYIKTGNECPQIQSWITWLEKQSKKNLQNNSFRRMFEQNLSWSEEDEKMFNDICIDIMEYVLKSFEENSKKVNWFKSFKERVLSQPKQEWSEEDKNRFMNLISLVKCSNENNATKAGFIEFIYKLRSQNCWKPSNEQLESLRCVNEAQWSNVKWKEIKSLYNDLKKL